MLTLPDIHIARLPTGTEATPDMQAAHERLFAEFDPDNPPVVRNIQALLNNPNAALIVAVSEEVPEHPDRWPALTAESYVGSLTLRFDQTLTQDVAHIPHVVVSREYQGRGVGKRLVSRALAECAFRGVGRLDLTSGPSKLAAHALYRSLGFELRDTNNWRYDFSKS